MTTKKELKAEIEVAADSVAYHEKELKQLEQKKSTCVILHEIFVGSYYDFSLFFNDPVIDKAIFSKKITKELRGDLREKIMDFDKSISQHEGWLSSAKLRKENLELKLAAK